MLDDRLQDMLGRVVESAIQTGEPVGSQYLVERYKLNISPATVRNYLAELEECGYLMQPHTSSGRIPTEKGYAYYIESIMRPRMLSKKEINELHASLEHTQEDNRRIKSLAKTAADLAQNAVVVGLNEADSYYTGLSNLFTQSEFKDWSRIVSMSDILDRLDDVLIELRQQQYSKPTILIGSQCPFGSMCGSVIISLSPNAMLCILGPIRMDYSLSVALLENIQSVFNQN